MLLTTLCYIEKDDQYLMLHRVKKQLDVNKDKWIGIGGKLEAGESPEDCVVREAKEETGLWLTNYRMRGLVTFISTGWEPEIMFLFTADGFTGSLADCSEGELRWVEKTAVRKLPVWEGDKYFLDMIEKDAPFFSMKLVYDQDRLTQYTLNGRQII